MADIRAQLTRVREAANDAAGSATDMIKDSTGKARESAGELIQTGKEKASEAYGDARDRGQRVAARANEIIQEHPVAAVAGGVLGALIELAGETAQAVTTAPAIYRTALALTVAGRTDEARVWMVRYNAITPPELVQQTQLIWARDQRKHPELAGVDWPPYQGRLSTFRFEAEPLSAP